MSFVHDDPEFTELLAQISDQVEVAPALVEKDYWITHSLWALHETKLAIWFKGGTSLSKGFGIIERFSEDLDLMIERGGVSTLPEVRSWASRNEGPTAQRRAFYDGLAQAFAIPDVSVELDEKRRDKYARAADYIGYYPGAHVAGLPSAMSPFVRFEVGRARVVPFALMPLTSFVHDHLARLGMSDDFFDNRPRAVRCVHPIVTLLEKLDALRRRYDRDVVEADGFVRHYEDAARIVQALDRLPPIETSALALAEDMLAQNDIAALPSADDPSLRLDAPEKRAAVERSWEKIAPMFWGPRIPLDDACATIRDWVRALRGFRGSS
ncbi:MAG: nucleotidyl transferase AbiEii/AbiGii toxin family protein [Sandaracinaceae bacterium]|nr:nucleotidyl transferase AbiEii/AbiGii toxin family protein [Sandaracinaceae bacterium]